MSAYWIGVFEATAADYKACMGDAPAGCTEPVPVQYSNWGVAGHEQHPVNGVNWAQSQAYCKWLGGDLPTEAQWEKAARGGCAVYPGKDCKAMEPKYVWGNNPSGCGQQAVFYTSEFGCNTGSTYPVGAGSTQGQSPYGAFDMAGNVWEWCLDWYGFGFYGFSAGAGMFKDPVNSVEPTYLSFRVIRGGSFSYGATYMAAAYRGEDGPSVASSGSAPTRPLQRAMSTLFKLPFVLAPQPEGGYTVTCPVLPELVTEGDTVAEALANVHDVIAAVRELYQDLGKPMPAMTVEPAQSPIWFEGLVTQP